MYLFMAKHKKHMHREIQRACHWLRAVQQEFWFLEESTEEKPEEQQNWRVLFQNLRQVDSANTSRNLKNY